MERRSRLAVLSVIGAVAIGGMSVWSFGSPGSARACPAVAVEPPSITRLTPAQRSEVVRIARADPLVKGIIGSDVLGETPPAGTSPGYHVLPKAWPEPRIGLVATVIFTPKAVVRGNFKWRNTGSDRSGCRTSLWTQDYEGDAATATPAGEFVPGAPQISATVSFDRQRVIALIPMVFDEPGMRPVGERDYLYRDK